MKGTWQQIELDEDSQILELNFEVGGIEWPDHTMVQTWASFEDPEDSDNIISYTCTAQYSQGSLFATRGTVKSFYGPSRFTVAEAGTKFSFDELNDIDYDDQGQWKDVHENHLNYASSFTELNDREGIST